MIDRYWQDFDTQNLMAVLILVGLAFMLLVIWLNDCSRTKQ